MYLLGSHCQDRFLLKNYVILYMCSLRYIIKTTCVHCHYKRMVWQCITKFNYSLTVWEIASTPILIALTFRIRVSDWITTHNLNRNVNKKLLLLQKTAWPLLLITMLCIMVRKSKVHLKILHFLGTPLRCKFVSKWHHVIIFNRASWSQYMVNTVFWSLL